MNFYIKSSPQRIRGFGGGRMRSSSVVSRILNRELSGICNKSRKSLSSRKRVYDTLPRRFAFALTAIVDDCALQEEGHVFLGFSSCDRFLISYTERIEEANHTGFLSHVYTLYWWLWSPGAKAKKFGSVRLFANEEIEYSLYLCYAEWPNLKSQIIVYGWRKFCDSCYITITAVPSIVPCKQCDVFPTNPVSMNAEEDALLHSRCVEHGFAMHFKQASGASQLGVLNSCGLKIDGILVLNIGHSIAVLSTGYLTPDTDFENLPLSSIKWRACEESITKHSFDEFAEKDSNQEESEIQYFHKDTNQNTNNENLQFMKPKCFQSPPPSQELCTPPLPSLTETSVYDIESDEPDNCERITLNGKTSLNNKENFRGNHVEQLEYEIELNIDPYFDPEPKSIVLSNLAKSTSPSKRAGATLPKINNVWEKFVSDVSSNSTSDTHEDYVRRNRVKGYKCPSPDMSMHNAFDDVHCANLVGGRKNLRDLQAVKVDRSLFLSPSSKPNNSILTEMQNSQETLRSELNFVTPSPTPSDGSSSVQFSTESNLIPTSAKCASNDRNSDGLVSFSENFYGPIRPESISPEEPLPVGETSLHYCSMFCQGANSEMLHPLEKRDREIQAFSQHLVLDVEHVIFDILRTRCYVAYKYGYLVDYEANVMDVCSSTKSVIVHVVALLNVERHRSKLPPSAAKAERAAAILQQAEFILSWSLHTGRYEVVIARSLKQYDERKYGEWKGDWIVKMDNNIKHKCSVRSNLYKSVYVLDNYAVLRGRSLNVLWNCDKTLAITK